MIIRPLHLTALILAVPAIAGAQQERPLPKQPAGSSAAFGAADPDAWIAERAPTLAIRDRTLDPFNRRKDPSQAPAQPVEDPALAGGASGGQPVPQVDHAAAFSTAVKSLKVGMVGSDMFMLGGARVRVGDHLALSVGEHSYRARVVAIRSTSITFEDAERGTRAELELSMLPEGMGRGAPPQALPPGVSPATGSNASPSLTIPQP